MRNNFTFCSGIKMKKLEKMEFIMKLLFNEKLSESNDYKILSDFHSLLDSFNKDMKLIKSYYVIDKFYEFYDRILIPYCRKELITIDKFEYFDFEQTQYVFDKMGEIIDIIGSKYGVE
jgi:hypothetical protein